MEEIYSSGKSQWMKKIILFYILIVAAINTACLGTELPVTSSPVSTSQLFQSIPTNNSITYGGIKIIGDLKFTSQTQAALNLLEQKDPTTFEKIQTYIGIIEQGEHSGMWAWEIPPRYEVGYATAFYSITWYASTIAHDATHSELYTQYQMAHPGQPVPQEAYGGVEIERFCIGYQREVAKRIGAPQSEIDYLSTLDGTHCDIDHDGDCDWDDYQNRDW
jgi:hypothetical protein